MASRAARRQVLGAPPSARPGGGHNAHMDSMTTNHDDLAALQSLGIAPPPPPPIESERQLSSPKQSTFKNALGGLPVPPKLLEGVHVIKVSTNGKMKRAFLTLSEDKFTIYITSNKVKTSDVSSMGLAIVKPILRKVRSVGSSSADDDDNMDADRPERAIDIGAIDRIQRGQNTLRFEQARKAKRASSSAVAASPRKYGGIKSFGGSSSGSVGEPVALDANRSFSIIFRGERTLDLMTTEEDDRNEILDALDLIVDAYKNSKVRVGNDVLLLRYIWLDVDKDKSNTIDVDELGKVLHRINFYMTKSQLRAAYDKFSKAVGLVSRSARRGGLTFEQCVSFLHKIKRDTWQVKPVDQIWKSLFGEFMNNGKPRMRVSSKSFLEKFLRGKQKERDATMERVEKLFLRLNEMEIANVATTVEVRPEMAHTHICKERFEAYLASQENDAFDPLKERHDPYSMNKPLSEYWISSSHNTYLTGDQLTSTSTAEMYMHVLYRGCRCVEIDIWNGVDPDNNPIPIVKHGHTMTTEIPFSDIIKAIKVFLNFNSDCYPILLSLENHCNIHLQEQMADLLTIILGHRLYIPEEKSLSEPLPSPEELKGMVILKGRRPLSSAEEDQPDYEVPDENGSLFSEQTAATNMAPSASKIAPALSRLTLFHGCAFRDWHESHRSPDHHMHSFVESKVGSLCGSRDKRREWIRYNQTHMSRIYPSGTRIDSSNYNPIPAWSTGSQLVALNFQTKDKPPLRINDGRFRENGNCGYVLKPSILMMDRVDAPAPPKVRLSVRVLTGSCLPKPKGKRRGECIDPYVRVELFDASETQGISQAFQTSHIDSNGFFPIWNQTKEDAFNFFVENGDVAVLQLTVWDKDPPGKSDDFIASASIPISCLRQGYRSVRLYDANNTQSGAFDFASLLIEVKMKRVMDEV